MKIIITLILCFWFIISNGQIYTHYLNHGYTGNDPRGYVEKVEFDSSNLQFVTNTAVYLQSCQYDTVKLTFTHFIPRVTRNNNIYRALLDSYWRIHPNPQLPSGIRSIKSSTDITLSNFDTIVTFNNFIKDSIIFKTGGNNDTMIHYITLFSLPTGTQSTTNYIQYFTLNTQLYNPSCQTSWAVFTIRLLIKDCPILLNNRCDYFYVKNSTLYFNIKENVHLYKSKEGILWEFVDSIDYYDYNYSLNKHELNGLYYKIITLNGEQLCNTIFVENDLLTYYLIVDSLNKNLITNYPFKSMDIINTQGQVISIQEMFNNDGIYVVILDKGVINRVIIIP